jgi:hypothetical protein
MDFIETVKLCNAGRDVNFMTEEKRDICEDQTQTGRQSGILIRGKKLLINIVAYLIKPRIGKPAETAVARKWLCNTQQYQSHR